MTDNRSLVDTYKSVIQPEDAPNPAKDFQSRYGALLKNDAADTAHVNVLTAPVPPDQAAKANMYARDLGMPAAAIDGQTHLYDQRKQAAEAAAAAAAHPNIARALADPRTAAAAADDTPAMRAISQQFQNFWKSKPQPKSWWQTIKDVPGEVGGALLAGGEQLSQSVVDATKSVVDVAQTLDPLTYINRALAPKGVTPEQVDAVSGYGAVQGVLGGYSKFIGTQADAAAPDLSQAGYVHRNLIQGIENVPSSVAALGATVMGNPKAGLALLGGTTYGQSYRQAREAGVSVPGAINYSLAQAGIEVATEEIPVMKFLEDTKVGTPFFKRLLKNFAAENVGEQAATVLQNFNQWAVIDKNQGKTFGDYLKEIPDQAAQTALAVASMVGTSNVAIGVGEQAVRATKAVDRLRTAKADAEALGGIISGAEASKLRQRDPETFRQFVQQTAEGTTAENVHIPAEAISTYMQSEDFQDEDGFFASIAPQVSEALATGGDVVVPTSDVATKLAGTKAWAALKDDARLSPGGLSIRETREQEAEIRKQIENVGTNAIEQANQQAVADTPRDQVFNDVRDQLQAIGFTKDAASAHAELMAANAETMGAMFGQTALEYHQSNPVDYVREGMAAATAAKGATVLDHAPVAQQPLEALPTSILGPVTSVSYDAPTNPDTGSQRLTLHPEEIAALRQHGVQISDDGNISAVDVERLQAERARRIAGGEVAKPLQATAPKGATVLDQQPAREPAPALTSLPASSPGPFQPAREAAERYASRAGLPYSPPTTYAAVDKERAARIAQAFEDMPHAPNDPEVRAAYDAMVDETLAQWREVEMSGLVVEFVDGEDPYGGNPWGAVRDVRDNNHLWVFNTEDGYGQGGITPEQEAENPMLAIVPGMSWSGKQVRVNDVFRAVHDYFGHIKEGVGFRARGEENAWRSHSAMYSPLARRAMTTETRGQNSWLNFGPYAESNRTASVEDTVFAEQKIGLLPQWATDEGALEDNAADKRDAVRSFKGTQVVGEDGKPRVVYHGTPFTFDDFRNRPKLDWFAERPETAAGYADPRRVRKYGGANIRPVYLDIRNPFVIEQEAGTVSAQDWLESVGLPRDLWPDNEPASAYTIYTNPDVVGEIKRRGHDGIRVPEGSSITWAPFSRAQIVSIFETPRVLFQEDFEQNAGGEIVRKPFSQKLFQNNNGPRGQIALYPDRSIVTLFENADASTLIHETGHLFLERLKRAALADNAPQQARDDWAAISGWFNDQNVPVTSDGSIPREAHELFARGFERYAMEGKAPAKRLERAFTAFRSWLLHIYQVVQNLRSPITPQVREVFGRMLATQQAIDEYTAEQHTKSLFATPEEAKAAVDMGPDEFAVYARTVIEARDAAFDALLYKTMHRIRQRVIAERRAEVTAARKAATDATDAEPRFRALRLLRTGQIDGAKTEGVLIDRAWLEEHLGDGFEAKLPKGPIIYKNGGLHPDEIADMTGFGSGAEMIDALVTLADEKRQMEVAGDKRQPRDRAIDDRVNALLDSKAGSDPLKDGSIEAEAVAAIQNDKLGEQIAYETRVLARRTKGRPTPYKLAREWAKTKIEAGKVNDVASRSAIQRYTRAAAKAARLAEEAILKGDIDETFRQKQAQMLNHALAVEANLAADEVDTIVARMKRLSTRAAMKSIDQDYFDRVQDLLERFDFKPQSQRALDEREGFAEWAANRQAQGFEVHVPPRLLETADHYSRVSVEELYGLRDTIDSLMKLGRLKQSILDAKDQRDFEAYVDDVMAHIRDLPTRKIDTSKGFNEAGSMARGFNAELIKIETIANELDNGDPNGPLTRLLVHRASDAENKRHALRESVLSPIAKAYLNMPKKQRLRLEEKVTIPELTRKGSDIDPRAGGPVVLTRMELLAVALNTGNASNMDKLSRGERWPAGTIRDVLNRELTKADWDFVQSMWDAIDSLWPEIAATERRMSGVVPEKVEATPITTSHGTYRGGYYPVVYDFDRSQQAENYRADDSNDLFGYASGVSTPKGHTIARTNARGPIRLSVEQVLFRHVEKVIARIAYAEYARDVLRVIENPKIRDGIDLKLGKEYRAQIKPWLKRVINGGASETRSAQWTQRFFRTARTNMTIAVMGFKASVGIAQTLGLTASAGQIGGWRVAQGIRDIMGDLARGRVDFQRFIFDRSPEMQRRGAEVNREIANLNNGIRAKTGLLHTARSAAMWHIAMVDRYMVAMPTWLGAHRKGIAEGMTDEQASRYADAMVRQSQGSGAEKDLAAVQSSANGEFQKWLTLFYTYFNVQHNAAWQAKRATQKGNYKRAIQLTGWFLLAAPLADALVSGDLPADDTDPEEWFGWFLRNVFFNLFAGVPGVRDAANFAERKISGQYSTTAFSPLDRLTDIGQRAAQEGYDVYSGEPVDGNTIRTAVSTPGYVFGLPSEQPAATTKFLWDYEHGDSDPKSVTDWYYGLTKGKVPTDKQGS